MATIWELISIALFTGIGSGFGNPIGQWFYKKFLEHRLDNAHDKVKDVGKKIANGTTEPIKIDTEETIRKMLGK
jgi:hypothetical protein